MASAQDPHPAGEYPHRRHRRRPPRKAEDELSQILVLLQRSFKGKRTGPPASAGRSDCKLMSVNPKGLLDPSVDVEARACYTRGGDSFIDYRLFASAAACSCCQSVAWPRRSRTQRTACGGNVTGASGSQTAHDAAVDQSPVSEARKGSGVVHIQDAPRSQRPMHLYL
jgi:hypothetical protein